MCSDHVSSNDGKADRTGVPWIIEQTGSAVAFQEYNRVLRVTAVEQERYPVIISN